MSSTNKTANYNLSQFVGTDIPSILNDYNGDMSKIDAAIAQVSSSAGSSAAEISGLQATVNNHTSQINSLNNSENALAGRVTTAEGQIASNTSAIAGKASTSDVNAVSNRVTAIEEVVPSTATSANKLATMADISGGGGGQIYNQDYLLYGDVVSNQSFNKADYTDMGHMFKAIHDYIASFASTGVQYIATITVTINSDQYNLLPIDVRNANNVDMCFAGYSISLGATDKVKECYASFTDSDMNAYLIIRKMSFASTSYGDNPSTTEGAVTGYEIVHTADETTTMPDSVVVHKLVYKTPVTP